MKRYKMLAVALLALAAATFTMASCSNSNDDDSSGGSSTENVTYSGSYTVGSNTYTSLKLTGTSAGGDATLSGASPTLSGTYTANSALSARTLSLSGTYTITFSNIDGAVTAEFSSGGGTVTLTGGVTGTGTADGGSGTTVTDSELAGYTYFYNSYISKTAYVFDNKETMYSLSNINSETVLADCLAKCLNDSDYAAAHIFAKLSYTFSEGTGEVEAGEGIYSIQGAIASGAGPFLAISYNGELYLTKDSNYSSHMLDSTYYTADNFSTVKSDIINKYGSTLKTDTGMYKVDSTFTAN